MIETVRELIAIDVLDAIFDVSFTRFLAEERENILKGVSEQNLCMRLALCIEREREARGIAGYFVETEYNRNGGALKTIIDHNAQIVTIRCDIIMHSRGHIPAQDNLLVIEMKWSNHPPSEKEKDRTRLRAMTKESYDDVWSADGVTLPEHVCGYGRGYYLELDTPHTSFLIERYAKGELEAAHQIEF